MIILGVGIFFLIALMAGLHWAITGIHAAMEELLSIRNEAARDIHPQDTE